MEVTLALFASIHFILSTSDPSEYTRETNRQGQSASAESFDFTGQTDSAGFSGILKFWLSRAQRGCRHRHRVGFAASITAPLSSPLTSQQPVGEIRFRVHLLVTQSEAYLSLSGGILCCAAHLPRINPAPPAALCTPQASSCPSSSADPSPSP